MGDGMPESQPGDRDPTALTTDALQREIAGLKELLEAQIQSLSRVVDERHRVVLEHVERLEFERREDQQAAERRVETLLGSARELADLQLESNREAIAKQEASNQKIIESMKTSFAADHRGLTARVDDLKERIDRDVSGRSLGLDAGKAWIVAAVAVVGGLLAIVLSLQ